MVAVTTPFAFSAILAGFITSLSLIMAIGAQNTFVLKHGIKGGNVLPLVLTCAGSDAILITFGVFGFEQIEKILPGVLPIAKYGGAAFLLTYGTMAFRAAWKGGESLDPNNAPSKSAKGILLTCLLITWFNPHVYLDTVVLLGSISAQYGIARYGFALGAVIASFAFFFALGYGARLLAPLFVKPSSWRVLEVLVGMMMWTIAISLLLGS